MYLGGSQATALRNKLLEAKNRQLNVPQILEEWVQEYLATNLGITADRVGKVYTSMWLNDCGGRGAYSFIRADGQPSNFNPRAQFRDPAFGRIHIGGSAFSEQEPTLTGGAQASAQFHLESIQREQAAGLDTIRIQRTIQRCRLRPQTYQGNNTSVILASSRYEPLERSRPRSSMTRLLLSSCT